MKSLYREGSVSDAVLLKWGSRNFIRPTSFIGNKTAVATCPTDKLHTLTSYLLVIFCRHNNKHKPNTKRPTLVHFVNSIPLRLASHAGIFRGARFSSHPTNACSTKTVGKDEKLAPLKMPAWDAT